MGEKQAIVKLTKEEHLFRAVGQTLGITSTTIWNILKKKLLVYWTTVIEQAGQGKQQQLMTKIYFESCEENPKNISKWHHQQPPQCMGEGITIHSLKKTRGGHNRNANDSSAVTIGRPDWNLQRSPEMGCKSFGTQSYRLMRPRLISTNMMEGQSV